MSHRLGNTGQDVERYSPLPSSGIKSLPEDPQMVATSCLGADGLVNVPASIRVAVWSCLLGVTETPNDTYLCDRILAETQDLPNQRVIRMDAVRTRGEVKWFRKPAVEERVVSILTFFCKSRGVAYRQGLNEVLAPFMMLRVNDATAYHFLTAMVNRFLPKIYADDEDFVSLQCAFIMFRLMLQYVDPELSAHLDQSDMPPELYATPWLITLFSRNLTHELVFALWDFLIVYNHPSLVHCVLLALVLNHRDVIMASAGPDLPGIMNTLSIRTHEQLNEICKKALELHGQYPDSIRTDLLRACYSNEQMSMDFLNAISNHNCIRISAHELLAGCTRAGLPYPPLTPQYSASPILSPLALVPDTPVSNVEYGPRFFLIDCRAQAEFELGHLPTAFHLNPELLDKPEELEAMVTAFREMKGCHFVLMGQDTDIDESIMADAVDLGDREDPVKLLVLYFLQKKNQYVSELAGGYKGLHAQFSADLGAVLVSHDAATCPLCLNPDKKASNESMESPVPLTRRFSRFAAKQGLTRTNVKARMTRLQDSMKQWMTRKDWFDEGSESPDKDVLSAAMRSHVSHAGKVGRGRANSAREGSELTEEDFLDQQCDKIMLQHAIKSEHDEGFAPGEPSSTVGDGNTSDEFVEVNATDAGMLAKESSDNESVGSNSGGGLSSKLSWLKSKIKSKFGRDSASISNASDDNVPRFDVMEGGVDVVAPQATSDVRPVLSPPTSPLSAPPRSPATLLLSTEHQQLSPLQHKLLPPAATAPAAVSSGLPPLPPKKRSSDASDSDPPSVVVPTGAIKLSDFLAGEVTPAFVEHDSDIEVTPKAEVPAKPAVEPKTPQLIPQRRSSSILDFVKGVVSGRDSSATAADITQETSPIVPAEPAVVQSEHILSAVHTAAADTTIAQANSANKEILERRQKFLQTLSQFAESSKAAETDAMVSPLLSSGPPPPPVVPDEPLDSHILPPPVVAVSDASTSAASSVVSDHLSADAVITLNSTAGPVEPVLNLDAFPGIEVIDDDNEDATEPETAVPLALPTPQSHE